MLNKLLMGVTTLGVMLIAGVAMADGGAAVVGGVTDKAYVALAAGLAIGIAAFGGALGQAKAAAATLEGIARNPAAADKLFVPMLLALALIESLVIYALVIAFRIS